MTTFNAKYSRVLAATAMLSVVPASFVNAEELPDNDDYVGSVLEEGMILEGFGEQPAAGLWGFDEFSIGANLSTEFNNNIFLDHVGAESDLIWRFGLPLKLTKGDLFGERWFSLSYVPSYKLYTDNSEQNSLEHDFKVEYQRLLAKTKFKVAAYASRLSGSERFSAGFVDRDTYGANIGVHYNLGAKSLLRATFGAEHKEYSRSTLFDAKVYDARFEWLYQATGKSSIGPYIGWERAIIDSNPSQTAFSLGSVGRYALGGKTTLTGFIGGEWRDFSGAGGSQSNVVFEFECRYQLAPKTSLGGVLFRKVTESYSDIDSSYVATGLGVTATYEFSPKLKFDGLISYENDNYFSTSSAAVSAIDADAYTFELKANYAMHKNMACNARIAYKINDNETEERESENFIMSLGVNKKF